MDSQGRSRLIVGGLTLAAVFLVISLLFTQQNGRVPVADESPLVNELAATVPADAPEDAQANAEEAGSREAESPLAAPDSPLANPGSASERVFEATRTTSTSDTVIDYRTCDR